MLVDYDVFVNVPRLDAQDRRDGAAGLQGGGVRLPAEAGIGGGGQGSRAAERHDGFAGARRTSARSKSGEAVPHYGPRP